MKWSQRFGLMGAVAAFAVAFTVVVALAAWSAAAVGTGTASATSLGPATSITAAATSPTSIVVSWAAPASGPVPSSYVVRRVAPTNATVCTAGSPGSCSDTGLSPATTYSYTIEARLASWSSGQTSPASATTQSATFLVELVAAGTKTAGVPFSVRLSALADGATDTSYAGDHTVIFSGASPSPLGNAPEYPTNPITFSSGVATVSVTLFKAPNTLNLVAAEGARTGFVTVNTVAAAASRLQFSSSTPSCASGSVKVGNGGSFTSKVARTDAYGNLKSGAAWTSSVSRSPAPSGDSLAPTSLSNTSGESETTGSFTYTLPTGSPPDVTVTAASAGLTPATCVVKKN